jgi:hypothetical protein
MVPNARSPLSARARAPPTLSSSQAIFVPEKYASMTRPVFARIESERPYGLRDRLARLAIPEDGRLALIRDADGRDVRAGDVRFRERTSDSGTDARPDLVRVVLDPTRLREVLGELDVLLSERFAFQRDDDRRRAGRPLIDREEVFGGHRRGGYHARLLAGRRPLVARDTLGASRADARRGSRCGSPASVGARHSTSCSADDAARPNRGKLAER